MYFFFFFFFFFFVVVVVVVVVTVVVFFLSFFQIFDLLPLTKTLLSSFLNAIVFILKQGFPSP